MSRNEEYLRGVSCTRRTQGDGKREEKWKRKRERERERKRGEERKERGKERESRAFTFYREIRS